MADVIVSQLTTLANANVAADDWVPVWDVSAGQFVKVRKDGIVGAAITGGGTIALGGFTFTVPATGVAALLGANNTFAGVNTFLTIQPTSQTLANAATIALAGTSFGVLLVENFSTGAQALIWLGGGGNSVSSISSRGGMSTAKNTASSVNVYYEGGSYYIQNNTGSSAAIRYLLIGMN